MKTIVKINWDHPQEQLWLCADNIALALSAYCRNTKFEVIELNELSGSEAIYGFCAWLSGRDKIVRLGSKENCAPIANLIEEFCKVNKLSEPINHWEKNLTHPT